MITLSTTKPDNRRNEASRKPARKTVLPIEKTFEGGAQFRRPHLRGMVRFSNFKQR